MKADDMILISVDDHIAEPADMFEAHVPAEVPGPGTPGRNRRSRIPAVVVWRQEGAEPRSERRRGQASGDVQRQPDQLQRDASGLFRRARTGTRHVGGWHARRPQLPQLDRILRSGAERRAGFGAERSDDQGLQRLACRRMVRQLSRPVHRVRNSSPLRRAKGGGRGASIGGEGVPRRHVLGESSGPPHAVDPLRSLGSPLRGVFRRGNGPVSARRVVLQGGVDVRRRSGLGRDGAVVGDVDLLAR